MSAYDPQLDVCIKTTKIDVEGKSLIVNIMSYNNGPQKVAVVEQSTKDPSKSYPVKRLTIAQFNAVHAAVNSGFPPQVPPQEPLSPPGGEFPDDSGF